MVQNSMLVFVCLILVIIIIKSYIIKLYKFKKRYLVKLFGFYLNDKWKSLYVYQEFISVVGGLS